MPPARFELTAPGLGILHTVVGLYEAHFQNLKMEANKCMIFFVTIGVWNNKTTYDLSTSL